MLAFDAKDSMADQSHPGDRTGLLLVDPYNDFLHEKGKLNGAARAVISRWGDTGSATRRSSPQASRPSMKPRRSRYFIQ